MTRFSEAAERRPDSRKTGRTLPERLHVDPETSRPREFARARCSPNPDTTPWHAMKPEGLFALHTLRLPSFVHLYEPDPIEKA